MRKGEKITLVAIVVISASMIGLRLWQQIGPIESDPGIPFYSTASPELMQAGSDIYREYNCKSCHTLWGIRDMTRNVPSPALDGIGSLHDEEWLYRYISAENPQAILPSRLKLKYQMPSFAELPDDKRRTLSSYLSSLKVEDWYLEETKKAEYEKLTGKTYPP